MRRSARGVVVLLLLIGSAAAVLAAQNPRIVVFGTLSGYDYNPDAPFDPAPPRAQNTIPAEVRALDGQKIQIYGNAMALDYSSGLMSEFILHSTADNCAFGATPRINDWIHVVMAGQQKARISTAVDVVVSGTLRIREVIEGGRVVGLYHLVADRVQ